MKHHLNLAKAAGSSRWLVIRTRLYHEFRGKSNHSGLVREGILKEAAAELNHGV